MNIENEREKLENILNLLGQSISRWTGKEERVETSVPGLSLFRRYQPTGPMGGMYEPSICLIAQGAKRVLLGDDTYVYDADHYLITAVHLPTIAEVITASETKPYLGLRLKFDLHQLAQLMADSKLPPPRVQQSPRGMAIGKVTLPLLSSFQRLLDLLEEEEDVPILAPGIIREITYRLLIGDQGERLRQISSVFSQGNQIARIIDWLKDNYTTSLRIEDLAKQASMSASSFHQHFKSITAMTPLQFQKMLRLNEARRMMLTEPTDASTAAFNVGYESVSQFNREYHRLFGAPPLRDIKKLREIPTEGRA
nr:AraC family transcriptional regulator [uncultured Desulfobulbus sp.]